MASDSENTQFDAAKLQRAGLTVVAGAAALGLAWVVVDGVGDFFTDNFRESAAVASAVTEAAVQRDFRAVAGESVLVSASYRAVDGDTRAVLAEVEFSQPQTVRLPNGESIRCLSFTRVNPTYEPVRVCEGYKVQNDRIIGPLNP